MSLGEKHKGEVWHEITGSISEEITLDEEGNGEFSVESRNLAVWVKKDQVYGIYIINYEDACYSCNQVSS